MMTLYQRIRQLEVDLITLAEVRQGMAYECDDEKQAAVAEAYRTIATTIEDILDTYKNVEDVED
jgi:hypothetical protein